MMSVARWYLIAVVIFVVDQVTKTIAVTQLNYADPVAVMPGFNFTLLYNTGAAFSFLADAGGWQRWFFVILTSIISIGLVVWIKRIASEQKLLSLALALVLGGALGNLYDRVLLGYVVDFVQWYYERWYWPAFNIADAAICVGGVLLLVDAYRDHQRAKEIKND